MADSSLGRTSGEAKVDELESVLAGTTSTSSSDQNSAFQTAVAAWRNIDLTALQKSLDNAANDIVVSQRDGLIERKELASKTKEFRKLDEEGRANEWKGLLKSYQTYIDHLTNSKKSTESVFLNLYNTLSEAPDPYPLLEATIDSLVSYSDVSKLNTENSRLNTTISRLNQQVASLEASLASARSDSKKKEDEIEREKAKVEAQWKGVLDERTRNWESKEKALGEKINDLEGVVGELRASYEVALKTGGAREDEDGRSTGRFAELEMVSRDLERVTVRLAEVECRNEELRLELANAKSDEGESVSLKELEEQKAEAARYHAENLGLMRKLELIQSKTEQDLKEQSRKAEKLERLLEGATKDKDSLKQKVAQFSDYEEIKRELEVLKTIEFSTGDEDDDLMDFRDGEPDEPSDTKGDKKETLEQLLLARNKKLGSELTVLRVSHQDLSDKLHALQNELDSTRSALERSNDLNARLEEDLAKMQSDPFSSAQSVAPSRYAPAPSVYGRGRISPTSSIISGYTPYPQDNLPTGGAGMLQMITAQRDRYKQKNAQLENDISKINSTVVSLRQEIESLRKDNVQLYEKTRYISSYSKNNVASAYPAASGFSATANQTIDRYKQAYEANISPFQAFRGRESARAVRKMGVAERIIYSLTRVILANRISRNIFVAYCVSLHLLCFMMLYHSASSEIMKNTAPVAEGVASESNWREAAYPGGK